MSEAEGVRARKNGGLLAVALPVIDHSGGVGR